MKIKVYSYNPEGFDDWAWYTKCLHKGCIRNGCSAHIEYFDIWAEAMDYAISHAEEIRAENKPEHYNNVHTSMGFGGFLAKASLEAAKAYTEQQRREQ